MNPSERATYIGGSDAAAALGLSPWKTPLALWLEKTGRAPRGEGGETAPMRWGTLLESVVAMAYAEQTGRAVAHATRLEHPEHPFIVGHVDRVTVTTPMRVVEIKTAGRRQGWGEEGSDDIPDHYAIQGLVYLALLPQAVACDFPVLIGGSDFRIYTLERADALIAEIIERLARWWRDHVVADRAPDPVTTADFQVRWKAAHGKTITADHDAMDAVLALAEAKAEAKRWKEAEEERANKVRAIFQDATELVAPNGAPLATWRAQETTRFGLEAFRAAHPDLAKQFTTTTTSRVLRLTNRTEKP